MWTAAEKSGINAGSWKVDDLQVDEQPQLDRNQEVLQVAENDMMEVEGIVMPNEQEIEVTTISDDSRDGDEWVQLVQK